MTPEAVKEAVRLLRHLDRAEELLQRVRTLPLQDSGSPFFQGAERHDRIYIEVLATESEATGVSVSDVAKHVRDHVDQSIDARVAAIRAQLQELGVELPTRPVPTSEMLP